MSISDEFISEAARLSERDAISENVHDILDRRQRDHMERLGADPWGVGLTIKMVFEDLRQEMNSHRIQRRGYQEERK